MKQIVLYFLAPVLFGAAVLFSCESSDNPTAPSLQPGAMVTAPAPSQPTNNTPPDTSRTATARFWTNGESVYTEIQNNRGQAENFVFVCYEDPTGQIEDQIILEPDHRISLTNGQNTGRLGLKMPKNKDGGMCKIQCDSVQRKTPRTIPYYTAVELLAYFERGTGLCEKPCEVDCEPDECTKGPDPSGPGLECEWLGDEICKWGCKCTPTTEPECPEQRWDYESCSWVGGCLCEPNGEPECAEQKWDPIKCKWVGDCECKPIGEKECPIQVWDPVKCKWVGDCGCTLECDPGEHLHPETCDCWCDPVGEPECEEQTWNEKKCQWEGDCECPQIGKPICAEQKWDPIKCKWVGDCCKQSEPECAGQTWDPKKCEWKGPCECEPDNRQECPEQTWDYKKCQWKGPCVCEPVGEPECADQKWDPKKCKWKGKCKTPCISSLTLGEITNTSSTETFTDIGKPHNHPFTVGASSGEFHTSCSECLSPGDTGGGLFIIAISGEKMDERCGR